VSYVHELQSDTRTIHAALVDPAIPLDSGRFSFTTNPADPNYFLIGASLTAQFNGGTTLYASYTGMASHDWRSENIVWVGINQAF
jgi:hypothetical protein